MTLVTGAYGYFVDWDGDGDFSETVEDVSEFVQTAQWEYGVDFSAPQGRSKTGVVRLRLDNSDFRFSSYNASSPLNAGSFDVLPGRLVKITMDAGAGAVTMFQAYLDSIVPTPGILASVSTAELVAYGPLSQLSDAEVHLAMQTNYRTDTAFDAIVDAVSATIATTADTGLTTMSRFFVSRNTSAMSILQELEDAESGLIRENKVGQIAFEARNHRLTAPHNAIQATFGSGGLYMWNLQQEDPLAGIFNLVEGRVRTFNTSDDMLLATVVDVRNELGGAPPLVPAKVGGINGTLTVTVEYPNPDTGSGYPAVSDWGTVDVEVNTAADGTGTDITNTTISLARTEYADRIEIAFTNTGAAAGYVIVLRVHGTAIVEGDPIPVKSESAASQLKYRKRKYPSPSNWLTDMDEAQDYCDHLIAMYAAPTPHITFDVKANYDAAHLSQASLRDVSDHIHIDASASIYSLGLDGDFYIEHIRHTVTEAKIHTMTLQCRAVVTDAWLASAPTYTPNVVSPPMAPADYICNALDPASRVIVGIQAREHTAGIYKAEFRAKLVAAGTNYPSQDLRIAAEGGTLVHNGTDAWVITGRGATGENGSQAIISVPTQGVLFYTARLANSAGGWGLWSDGNFTPKLVTARIALDDPAYADTGPAADWSISVKQGETAGFAVVSFTRPATYGHKVLAVVVQIVNARAAGFSWLAIDDASKVIYDGSAIAHTYNKSKMTITKAAGNYSTAAAGDLILFDVRGGAFDKQYCGWGTIPVDGIDGVTLRYLPGFVPWSAEDVNGDVSDIRIKIVTPPWAWTTNGYLGSEANRGLWDKVYWIPPNQGDKTTQTFVTDPIQLPSGVAITDIKARAWIQNGYFSRSDDDTYSDFGTGGGSATGAGCVLLSVVAGAVATNVNLGNVFAINSGSDFTLSNPTGTPYCGMTIVWAITGAGVPTLGSKFRLMSGEAISKSDSRDLLGAIYNAADDEWDAFWKRGVPVASKSASASLSASASASKSSSASASASAS